MKKEYLEPEFELVRYIFNKNIMDLTVHSATEGGDSSGDLGGDDDIEL